MSKEKVSYVWEAQQAAKNCETINCPQYDHYADFRRDPTGVYVLIRLNWHISRIEVAICDKDHHILKVFSGRTCQDLYDTIFKYEKKYSLKWFVEKTHIAYLGKELKKAELALTLGQTSYFQE